MQKGLKISILLITLLMFPNCFDLGLYISEVPIGSPGGRKADERLIGIWEKIDDKNIAKGQENLEFILFNDFEYVIRAQGNGNNNLARAFIVKVGHKLFLNIQDLSENERKFIFCSYEISADGKLTLNFVSDTLFVDDKLNSVRKLFKFIRKNRNNPELFDSEIRLQFIKKQDSK